MRRRPRRRRGSESARARRLARTPCPRSTSPPSGRAARRMICSARRRPSGTAAPGGALRERPQCEAAQGGLGALQRIGADRHRTGAGPRRLERLQHDPLQKMRLLDQLGLRFGDVPLGGLRSAHAAPAAPRRAPGCARSRARGSSRRRHMAGGPRSRGGGSRRAPAPAAVARRGRCARPGRAALAFRARRRGGTAPSRPGRSACGRLRSSRCPCGRAAAPRRRSGSPAPRPGGFHGGGSGRSMWRSIRSREQRSRQTRSSRSAEVRRP